MSTATPGHTAEEQLNSTVGSTSVHPSERTDESVAQKANDPTAYLRRFDLDTDFNWINYSQLSYKVTPAVFTPLGDAFRLRLAAPLYIDSPSDKGNVRLGDVFAGLTYIPFKTEHYSPFLGLRVDFPTGDAAKGAGIGVAQITPTGGVVIYSLMKYGVLIPAIVQYKQTVFEDVTKPKLSSLVFRPNMVFFPSRTAYARADWTITVDNLHHGRTASRLLLELGNIFAAQYKIAIGYEWDLWGAADDPETEANLGGPTKVGVFKLNLSYLF